MEYYANQQPADEEFLDLIELAFFEGQISAEQMTIAWRYVELHEHELEC